MACVASNTWSGEYHLGQGYTSGDINIAGYASFVADVPTHGVSKLNVEDLSVFITGHVNKYINPFLEAELTEGVVWQEGGTLFSDTRPWFVLERLYNDSHITDHFSLRIGKMLTPVGEWNTIHAAPLVWTTSRPMTTYRSFNEYTSGLSLNYSQANDKFPEIQLYWQPDSELVAKPKSLVVREYQNSAGIHLNWPIGLNDKVGFSLQHANPRGVDEVQTLYGLNVKKTLGKFQLETEATYTQLTGNNPARVRGDEWGAYLLGAYSLTDRLNLIARYESFVDRGTVQSSNSTLVGLTYRPDSAMVWKVEYIKNSGAVLDVRTGLFASFSVLF
jgi:hypothetical protein